MTYKKINFIFGFGKASINIDTPLVELYRNKSHMILLYGYLETINDSHGSIGELSIDIYLAIKWGKVELGSLEIVFTHQRKAKHMLYRLSSFVVVTCLQTLFGIRQCFSHCLRQVLFATLQSYLDCITIFFFL